MTTPVAPSTASTTAAETATEAAVSTPCAPLPGSRDAGFADVDKNKELNLSDEVKWFGVEQCKVKEFLETQANGLYTLEKGVKGTGIKIGTDVKSYSSELAAKKASETSK